MSKFITRVALSALPCLHAALAVCQEAAPAATNPPVKAFAAPTAAASLPSGTASGIGQATLALLFVLAAIFAIAWLARRMRGVARGGSQGIDVIAQAAVGPRERVIIVRIGTTQLLLGVAPGRVTHLHDLPADLALGTPKDDGRLPTFVESFRSLMTKGRGK